MATGHVPRARPILAGHPAVPTRHFIGAILTLWAATLFWRHGVGSRWSRIHHTLIAASSVMITLVFPYIPYRGNNIDILETN